MNYIVFVRTPMIKILDPPLWVHVWFECSFKLFLERTVLQDIWSTYVRARRERDVDAWTLPHLSISRGPDMPFADLRLCVVKNCRIAYLRATAENVDCTPRILFYSWLINFFFATWLINW